MALGTKSFSGIINHTDDHFYSTKIIALKGRSRKSKIPVFSVQITELNSYITGMFQKFWQYNETIPAVLALDDRMFCLSCTFLFWANLQTVRAINFVSG